MIDQNLSGLGPHRSAGEFRAGGFLAGEQKSQGKPRRRRWASFAGKARGVRTEPARKLNRRRRRRRRRRGRDSSGDWWSTRSCRNTWETMSTYWTITGASGRSETRSSASSPGTTKPSTYGRTWDRFSTFLLFLLLILSLASSHARTRYAPSKYYF